MTNNLKQTIDIQQRISMRSHSRHVMSFQVTTPTNIRINHQNGHHAGSCVVDQVEIIISRLACNTCTSVHHCVTQRTTFVPQVSLRFVQ